MSFQEELDNVNLECGVSLDRLKRSKLILDKAEEAYYDILESGGVREYKIDTGQTITEVKVAGASQAKTNYLDALKTYNEFCGLYKQTNLMVLRDATTLGRG